MSKYCPNCGKALSDHTKFCGFCGYRNEETIQPVQPTQAPEKKAKSVKPLLIIVIAAVVLAAAVIGYLSINSPARQAIAAVKAGNYASAAKILNQHEKVASNQKLLDAVSEQISSIQTDYEQETMDYEDAEAALNDIGDLGISSASPELEEARHVIYDLYCSRTLHTVYLLTSQTFQDSLDEYTYAFDYDEKGRLTGISEIYSSTYPVEIDQQLTSLEYRYDDAGRITEILANANGEYTVFTGEYQNGMLMCYNSESCAIDFAYDAEGRLIRSQWTDNDDPGEPYRQMELTYDENGALYERTYIALSSASFDHIERYDAVGRLCEWGEVQVDTSSYSGTRFYFDEDGKVIRKEGFTDDTVNFIHYYTYDAKGNLLQVDNVSYGNYSALSGYTFDGTDTYREVVSSYLDADYLEGVTELDGNYILEYDSAGNLIRFTRMVDGTVGQHYAYTYEAVELPLNYQQPDFHDPIYLLNATDFVHNEFLRYYFMAI